MVERVKEGGASKVVEAFTSARDPLQELRKEGEVAAKSVRERLDQVSPGLGNPVIPVKVAVNSKENGREAFHDEELGKVLVRIEERLSTLAVYLEDESQEIASSSK